MNIAAGLPQERGKPLSDMDPKGYISKSMAEKFNGYFSIAIKGKHGLEEGTLVMHNGDIVSSDYEYYRFNKSFKAEDGFERCLNALYAKSGILDSFSLTSYQVQLVLTLNEEANLREKVTRETLKFPDSFSYSFEESLSAGLPSGELSRIQLFKKLGLAQDTGGRTTKEALLRKAKSESTEIEEAFSKKE